MKILHLLSQTILTGAESYAIELSNELEQQGHQVWICSDTLHLPTTAKTLLSPVHERTKWLETEKILNPLITEKQIQIIHSHSRSSAKLARRLCKTHPYLCHVHTFHGLQRPTLSKKITNSFGDANIFVCENIQLAMQTESIRFAKHHMTIRNGIRHRTRDVRKDADASRLKIAIVSRLSNLKGQRTLQLLKAAVSLFHEYPHMEIHLYAGDFESLPQQDREFIRSLEQRSSSHFFFHGFAYNLTDLLSQHDLICGGGRIAAEALIQGLPVFAFGESCPIGFVDQHSVQTALQSNFGDIQHNVSAQQWTQPELTRLMKHGLQKLALYQNNSHSSELNVEVFQLIQDEFSFENNISQILLMYRQTMGRKLHSAYFPILMYHKIVPEAYETPHQIFVVASDFEKHLQFYQQQGFTTLHFKDYQMFRDGQYNARTFPRRPLMITFDDGYLNNLEVALPLLEKYQMKATVFLLANNQIQTNQWDVAGSTEKEFPLMNPEQRLAFSKHPLIEIGSHGFSHAPLSSFTTRSERLHELGESKKSLEHELQREITVFAYTYGTRTTDASKIAECAGYHFAVNTDTGGLQLEDDPWSLFRISIFPHETRWSLWKKTRGFYRWYYRWKRKK